MLIIFKTKQEFYNLAKKLKKVSMKKSLLLFILGLINLTLFSQTLETVMWGESSELPKKTSIQSIIGTNSEGFYAIRSDDPAFMTRDKAWLEWVSYGTMNVDESNEIVLPTVSGTQTLYDASFFINNKIILFSSASFKNRNQKVSYISYLNTNGTVKNKPREVGAIPVSNVKADGFHYKYLPESKNIMMYYHKTYTKYNGEKFTVKIFDSNLKEVFNEDLVFPENMMNRKNKLVQIEQGKSGNIYMLFKIEMVSTKSRRGKSTGTTYGNLLAVYNVKKKAIKTYDITFSKFKPYDVRFTFDKDEIVVLGGTISPKTKKFENQIMGMFYAKINPKTEKRLPYKNIKEAYYDISRDKPLMATFNNEKSGPTQNDRFAFKVKDVKVLDNGAIAIVAEQFYKTTKEFKDPETKKMIKINYLNYNDLLVGEVNANGKFEWVKRFYKRQFSVEDGGHFSSYALSVNVNTLKFMFNDVEKNIKNTNPDKTKTIKFNPKTQPKGIAVLQSVYTDGSTQKTTMFGGKDAGCVIVPRTFTEFSDGYLIATRKGKTYRFAQFVFE